jgi:hypothetical protein
MWRIVVPVLFEMYGKESQLNNFAIGCHLLKDIQISIIEEGRALNSWLIGLWF